MATWTPDPTFYPSPRLAAQAPPEKLAYVVAVRTRSAGARRHGRGRRRSRLGELRPDRRQGRAPAPATSCTTSAGTPAARACARTRRTRTSSGATWSCRACAPRASTSSTPSPTPTSRRSSAPSRRRRSPSAPATRAAHRPLRAGRHLRQRARQRRRQGPGRRVHDGPRDLRRARPLGGRPRPAAVRLRLLVAPRPRHHGDQRMGHARHGRERADPREDPGRPVRPPAAFLGPAQAQARAGDRLRRQVPAGVRAAPGARPDQGVRLRQLRAVARGPVVVDLDLVPRRRQVGGEEGDHDPGGAGRGRKAAAGAAGLQGGGAARHRHRPLGRRQVPLRVVLGDRRLPPVRRVATR